jgi:FkbM family methyltransferase
LPTKSERFVFIIIVSRYLYLISTYIALFSYALKRSRLARSDFSGLLFLFLAPILYFIPVKMIRSPFGNLIKTTRAAFRSFVYGFFKTYFAYSKDLSALFGESKFPVVMDVGANIGDFVLGMKQKAEKIVAIEPGSENFKALVANLKANHITNVLSLNVASTDNNRTVFLQGNNSDLFVSGENFGETAVGQTLDQIIKNCCLENVELVKIDVQGHELQALKGLHQNLELHSIKTLLVEIHLNRGVRTEQVVQFMKGFGYRLIYEDNWLFQQPHLYFMI